MEVMTDEPISLTEAFDKASSTLQNSSESEKETEPVKEEENQDDSKEEAETPETPEAETKESLAEKSETDLESIDPKTLPPELKPHYDNLMKGFTKGRQKDSEARKQAELERDELKRQLTEIKSKTESGFEELTKEQLQTLNPEEMSQYYQALSDYKAQKAVEAQKVNDFREQALNDYESFDDRLRRPSDAKPNNNYDRFMDSAVGAALDQALADYTAINGTEIGFPYKDKLAELVTEYDGYVKQQNSRFIESQNQKLKESSEKLKKTSPQTSKATAAKNKPSLSEALQMAQEKLGN
jgi:hypothetical protein